MFTSFFSAIVASFSSTAMWILAAVWLAACFCVFLVMPVLAHWLDKQIEKLDSKAALKAYLFLTIVAVTASLAVALVPLFFVSFVDWLMASVVSTVAYYGSLAIIYKTTSLSTVLKIDIERSLNAMNK